MKSCLALLALAPLSFAAPLPLAIGTNTGGSGKSEGIYLTSFDPATGEFGEVKLGAKYEGPGFLTLHPSKPLLYSVGKSKDNPKGSVAVFKLGDPLEFVAEAPSGGAGPCHLAVNASATMLAVANYGDGSTAAVRLNGEGLFEGPGFSQKIEGKGPRADRQDGPHAHGVYFSGDLLQVPDLGLDRILTYSMDPAAAKPTTAEPAHWDSAPGSGPRHIDFSPDGRHAYIINELNNTVTACSYDVSDGTFETLQTVSTLPDGDKTPNTTAEIAVHPSGKYVYASNRGHDSIAVFSRDPASGQLTPVQITPCGGKVPRHFALTPDGKWLLCAHQDSNTLAALPLDPGTGKLGEPTKTVACPNPICILFLPVR